MGRFGLRSLVVHPTSHINPLGCPIRPNPAVRPDRSRLCLPAVLHARLSACSCVCVRVCLSACSACILFCACVRVCLSACSVCVLVCARAARCRRTTRATGSNAKPRRRQRPHLRTRKPALRPRLRTRLPPVLCRTAQLRTRQTTRPQKSTTTAAATGAIGGSGTESIEIAGVTAAARGAAARTSGRASGRTGETSSLPARPPHPPARPARPPRPPARPPHPRTRTHALSLYQRTRTHALNAR